MMNNARDVVTCYGITKDPKTNDFIMVMNYANNGSLRKHLNNSFNSMNWDKKNEEGCPVALKCLHNSQDITAEFLREVGSFSF